MTTNAPPAGMPGGPRPPRGARLAGAAVPGAPARVTLLVVRAPAWLTLAALVLSAPALARACPVAYDLDAMEAAIRAAPDCRAAAGLARDCALGAGGDVALAGAVSEVCERDFLPGLDRPGRAAYARRRAACLAEHRNEAGTMYRAAEAFCQAGVSERFSRRALGAKPGR